MTGSIPGRRRRLMRARSLVLTVVLGVLAVGCAGPREPLEVGVADVASDIVLGAVEVVQVEAPPAPVPPNAMPVRRVVYVPAPQPEPPVFPELAPPPDLGPCPPASPIASPRVVAPNDVTLAPAPATYTYRNDGRFETSGANATKGSFPELSTREVTDVVANDDGAFSFDVRATLEQTVTTTTYLVQPAATAEPGLTGTQVGGMYIDRIVTQEYAEGVDPSDPASVPEQESTFDPSGDGIQLATLPLVTGEEVQATAIDPESGQVLAMDTTVGVKDRVDACGDVIDVHVLEIDGEFGQCPEAPPVDPPVEVPPIPGAPAVPVEEPCVEPGGNQLNLQDGTRESFHAVYRLAPQYGGLIVSDAVEILTEGVGGNVFRTNTAVIDRLPLDAVEPPPPPAAAGSA